MPKAKEATINPRELLESSRETLGQLEGLVEVLGEIGEQMVQPDRMSLAGGIFRLTEHIKGELSTTYERLGVLFEFLPESDPLT